MSGSVNAHCHCSIQRAAVNEHMLTKFNHCCRYYKFSHHCSSTWVNHQIEWFWQSITFWWWFFAFPIFISKFVFLLINPIVEFSWVSSSEFQSALWMKAQSGFNVRVAFRRKSRHGNSYLWLCKCTSLTHLSIYNNCVTGFQFIFHSWFMLLLLPMSESWA